MYAITLYTKRQAKANNLKVQPSTTKYKKLDVYTSKGDYITSVGDKRYADYPTYVKTMGKPYADKRRELYHIRHKKDSGPAGQLARLLLW